MKTIWKGGIRFGLVYIPINLYSGVTTHNLDFDMLREGDECPKKYVRVYREDGKEVLWNKIVKGYKEDDEYIVLSKDDFKAAASKRIESLDIFWFVDLQEVSSRFFKKTYLIEPQKGAANPCNLLRKALEKSELVGLCKFGFRNRQKLGMLRASEEHIYLLKIIKSKEKGKPVKVIKISGGKKKDSDDLLEKLKASLSATKRASSIMTLLSTYQKKKDFYETREPKGKTGKKNEQPAEQSQNNHPTGGPGKYAENYCARAASAPMLC